MLIYVLVHCDQIHIEIEVEYMWGLLDPSLLSGEGGYYLTTLSSASKLIFWTDLLKKSFSWCFPLQGVLFCKFPIEEILTENGPGVWQSWR